MTAPACDVCGRPIGATVHGLLVLPGRTLRCSAACANLIAEALTAPHVLHTRLSLPTVALLARADLTDSFALPSLGARHDPDVSRAASRSRVVGDRGGSTARSPGRPPQAL